MSSRREKKTELIVRLLMCVCVPYSMGGKRSEGGGNKWLKLFFQIVFQLFTMSTGAYFLGHFVVVISGGGELLQFQSKSFTASQSSAAEHVENTPLLH